MMNVFVKSLSKSLRLQKTLKFYVLPSIYKQSYCNDESSQKPLPQTFAGKYKLFAEEELPIILDVEEEKRMVKSDKLETIVKTPKFEELDTKRGVNGVFEIQELVHVIKQDKVKNLVVLEVPPEKNYVDYMLIGTCSSRRHIIGLAELIIKIFKKKRFSTDSVPSISSETSDWIALDLGNIALHLMLGNVRNQYDLESLWSVGPEYDLNAKKNITNDNDLHKIFEKHDIDLNLVGKENCLG